MTLTLERALKHMSWANQEVYKLIIALPDEALDAYATDPEWNVGEILRHIASSSGGYGARLKGVDAEVLVRPTTMQDLQVIAKKLLSNDVVWLYFDGLLNNTLTGNEINGVPVNGFAMAVRSWTVTIRGNQTPTVTLNSGGYSPCSTTGTLPFCDDAVPQFAAIHGQS